MTQPTKVQRRRQRLNEARKMISVFKRIGTDNPPTAHERIKMEAWRASRPSQLSRFERETGTGRKKGART